MPSGSSDIGEGGEWENLTHKLCENNEYGPLQVTRIHFFHETGGRACDPAHERLWVRTDCVEAKETPAPNRYLKVHIVYP